MEAHYRAFNGKLVVKVEGSTIKDLFEQIGPVAEVLDGDDACGKCNSPHIYPRAREAKGFTYYELVCSDCSAKLSFGQHKDGGNLWAKRTDENGMLLMYIFVVNIYKIRKTLHNNALSTSVRQHFKCCVLFLSVML